MSSSRSNRHLNHLVGAIVVCIVVAVLAIFALFSSGSSFQRYTLYRVYMQESVSGLTPDSAVEYNGVDVGSVKEVAIEHKNPHYVKLLLSIQSSTLVTVDTVATLQSKGLTGISYISLSLIGNNLTPLKPHPGQAYAIIPTRPSYFMQVDAMLTHLNTVIGNVKSSFQALLNKDDLETMRETYYSVDHIIAVLQKNPGDISAIIKNTQVAITSIGKFKLYKDNIKQMIQLRISPFGFDLIDRFATVLSTLAEAATVLKDHPSATLLGVAPSPGGPGEANRTSAKRICDSERIDLKPK